MKFTEVYITSYYLKQIDVFLAYKIGIEYIKQNPEFIPENWLLFLTTFKASSVYSHVYR